MRESNLLQHILSLPLVLLPHLLEAFLVLPDVQVGLLDVSKFLGLNVKQVILDVGIWGYRSKLRLLALLLRLSLFDTVFPIFLIFCREISLKLVVDSIEFLLAST